MKIILVAEKDDVDTVCEFWDLICDSCNRISSSVKVVVLRPYEELREN